MNNPFDIRYKIHSVYACKEKKSDTNIIPIMMEIQEVVHLYDVIDNPEKVSVVIDPKKWRNICLEKIDSSNTTTLISMGAELIETIHLFRDNIDAGIQMAFIASRADIKASQIFEATRGIVTKSGYLQLQELFYQDYPEKFI